MDAIQMSANPRDFSTMTSLMHKTASIAAILGLSLLAACGPEGESAPTDPQVGHSVPVVAPREVPKLLVTGTPGDETVAGGDGAEQIVAGPGADILSGGGGGDDFVLEPGFGRDWIADFQPDAGDRIVVRIGTPITVGEHEAQLVLDFGNGDVLGLVGVPRSAFSEAWLVKN